jgi:hypothetical protein
MQRLALIAALASTACGKPAEQPKPAPSPAPAAVAPPLVWSAEQGALILRDHGAELLKIECAKDKGLTVHGERFKPVGSEERMSVGAGDVVVTLVATPDETVTPTAMKGEGPADPDFLRALGEGRKVAVNYGYQNMGAYDGPPRDIAEPFTAACMPR